MTDFQCVLECLAALKLVRFTLDHPEDLQALVECRREVRRVIATVESVVPGNGPAPAPVKDVEIADPEIEPEPVTEGGAA